MARSSSSERLEGYKTKAMSRIADEMVRRGAKISDFKFLVKGVGKPQDVVEEIARDILREITWYTQNTFTIQMDRKMDLAQLAKEAKIDINFLELNDPRLAPVKRGKKTLEVKIIRGSYGQAWSLLKYWEKRKFRPATLQELLTLISQYKSLADRLTFLALGSPFKNRDYPGDTLYPFIFTELGSYTYPKKIRKLSYQKVDLQKEILDSSRMIFFVKR